MKRVSLLLPFLILFLTVLGCDPGIRFRQKAESGNDPKDSVQKFDGFEIAIGSIGGLIGQRSVVASGCIINRRASQSKFEIGDPRLKTAKGEFYGMLDNKVGNDTNDVRPGDCQPFSIQFKFDKELDKVLTKPVSIEMKIKNGSSVSDVSIPMEQEY